MAKLSSITGTVFPINQAFKQNKHFGIDVATPANTILFAPGPGKVILSEKSKSAGEWIIIYYPKMGFYLVLMHLSTRYVAKDQMVKTGDQLGLSGNTGEVIGSGGGWHLHLETRKKWWTSQGAIDPATYFDLHS